MGDRRDRHFPSLEPNAECKTVIADHEDSRHQLSLTEYYRNLFPKVATDSDGEVVCISYEDPLEAPSRGTWGGKIEFFLTCVGFAVGLGNVWRFPYLCYENGGGAFLLPYCIMLITVGLPLFFIEFAVGQFASLGPISVWSISPLFKGIGVAMVVCCGLLTLYYNIIISHCFFYLFASMRKFLPWDSCGNFWNDQNCVVFGQNVTGNSTAVSSAEQYYENYLLEISSGLNDFGVPSWKILLCLFACWVIVALVLIKGIHSLGKVAYFSAIFPYILLTVLLVRGCSLPGAANGILFYINPVFSKLANSKVWVQAATQIFFSLSVCNGGLITMASYNKFKNNCCRDALIVAILNCATSIYAGFVVFANLGFMAYKKNVTVDKVAQGGPGLVFVVYPEAIAQMPFPPIWAILFFIMMLTLGFGSQFSLVETVLSGFQDELRRAGLITNSWRQILYRITVCFIGFALGIPMTCRGGMYLLNLVDTVLSSYPMLIIALSEIIVICYLYGLRQFRLDISLMTNEKPNWYWRSMWLVVTPCVLTFLLIFLFVDNKALTYRGYNYTQPWLSVYHCIGCLPAVIIAAVFLYRYCKDGGFILLREYLKPHQMWGPAESEHRNEFMDLIRSNESLRKKAFLDDKTSVEPSKLDSEELKNVEQQFFQSKKSAAEKLHRVASKEGNMNTRINDDKEVIHSDINIARSQIQLKPTSQTAQETISTPNLNVAQSIDLDALRSSKEATKL